jgi:hypothetical protein
VCLSGFRNTISISQASIIVWLEMGEKFTAIRALLKPVGTKTLDLIFTVVAKCAKSQHWLNTIVQRKEIIT